MCKTDTGIGIDRRHPPKRSSGETDGSLPPMALVRHISVEHRNFASLDLAHPGEEREQSGFADAVRAEQPDYAVGGNIEGEVVERERPPVAVGYPLDPGDNGVGHCGSFTTSSGGQAIFGSVRTKPRPRTPVFTCRWY